MNKIRLAVLFGGVSSEYEVSCVSASSVLDNLDRDKYEIYKIGITKDGRWFLTMADTEQIKDGRWADRKDNISAVISPDRGCRGLLLLKDTETESIRIDCIYPVVHGKNCEDGVLQGLLELSGIPYVGPGVAASACSMDKAITKLIAGAAGINQADYVIVTASELKADETATLDRVEAYFNKYPLFIKPANEGSSVGISKVHDRAELGRGLAEAAGYDEKILVEETIVGREIETAVLGNDKPEVAKIGEIFSCNEFYDYEAKYADIGSRTGIIDDISPELETQIKETAVRVFKAMGCKGMSRIDFFLTEDNRIILNELNTLPGFTSISMYPKMWEAAGVPYPLLLDRLIALAME